MKGVEPKINYAFARKC